MTTYARLGSVSSGTLRPEDLIPVFVDVLRELDSARCAAFLEDWPGAEDGGASEDDQDCLDELFPILEEFAPPYCYFGTLEGDGADFGFWFASDSFEEACRGGEILKIDSGDEWPDALPDGVEYVAEVTDHGNVSLFTTGGECVWAIV